VDQAKFHLFSGTEQGGDAFPGEPGTLGRGRPPGPGLAGGPDEKLNGGGKETDTPGLFLRIILSLRGRDGELKGPQGNAARGVEEKVVFQHSLTPDLSAGALCNPGLDPYPIQGKGGRQGRQFHLHFPGEGMIHQEADGPVFPGKGGLRESRHLQPGRSLGFQEAGQEEKGQEPRQEEAQ
jgi:hypothetical protein